MEEIREMFIKLQSDVSETKKSLEDMESNITKNINNNINEILGNIQIKVQHLEEKNESQERRLDTLERTQRQRNVVMFGVDEGERGYDDLTKKVLVILNDTMSVPCSTFELQAVRRIGKIVGKIRPVVITFTTLGRKIEVQRKWKTLQRTSYSIADDYPPKVLEIRKSLFEQARIEKEKGNRTLIKYDKLIIIPLPPNSDPSAAIEKRNSKRALSQTPPQVNPNNRGKGVQSTSHARKKNKISSYWNSQQLQNKKGELLQHGQQQQQ